MVLRDRYRLNTLIQWPYALEYVLEKCWKYECLSTKIPDWDRPEWGHTHTRVHTHTQTRRRKKKVRVRERGRETERAVNSLVWCVLKPHKMASNQGRDMLRREEVFSVWFTLKPSLIPVWWLPWVFAVPDLTPIPLTQSNFWALFELPRASYLITNREREEGSSTRTWPLETPHTGSIIIIKACPSGLTRDFKKKAWWMEME